MTTATKQNPVSVRFPAKIHQKLNSFANISKRTHSSIIQEAVNIYITSEEEKIQKFKKIVHDEEDIVMLKSLIEAGYDSGEPIDLKSTEDLIKMAKKKHNC